MNRRIKAEGGTLIGNTSGFYVIARTVEVRCNCSSHSLGQCFQVDVRICEGHGALNAFSI